MNGIYLMDVMEKWIILIKHKLATWLTGFVQLLPNLAIAIIVFILFFFAARYIRRFVNKLLMKLSEKPAISGLFSSIIYILVLFIGLFISLDLLHLEKTISSLLAGAGIIGLALGFAFQDLTANFISGIFIIFRKPFDTGNIVDTNGFIGTVEEIQLRSTTIRTYQGLHIMVPNKDIFQKPITNYSLSTARRIDIALTLPAKINTDDVEHAVRDILGQIPAVNKEKKPEIYFTDYSGDNLKLELWCWTNSGDPVEFLKTRDEIIRRVHAGLQSSTTA